MINMQAVVKDAFKQIAKNVSGVLRTITYYRLSTAGVYDPVTGVISNTYTQYTVTDAIVTSFKNRETYLSNNGTSTQIEASDQKMLIPYLSLPVSPRLDDYIVLDGDRWDIINIVKDPTGSALYTFQIRRG